MNYYEHKPGSWRTYQLLRGSEGLPKMAGVYAIYFDDALVYIGSSVDVRNRFSEHKIRYGYGKNIITPWNSDVPDSVNVSVKIKRSRVRGDWAMWEIRLIHRLRPEFNRQHRGRRAA